MKLVNPYSVLSEIFYLDGEDVLWKARNADMFKTQHTYTSFNRHKANKVVSAKPNKDGYCFINFLHKDKKYSVQLHRLKVALLYKADLSHKDVVDHINKDTSDNSFNNLRLTNHEGNAMNVYQSKLNGLLKGIYKTKLGWLVSKGKAGNKRAKTFCEAIKIRKGFLNQYAQ